MSPRIYNVSIGNFNSEIKLNVKALPFHALAINRTAFPCPPRERASNNNNKLNGYNEEKTMR